MTGVEVIHKYITYIRDVRRYSPRTVSLYGDALESFCSYISMDDAADDLIPFLNVSQIRSYMVWLMDERHLTPKSVSLHMSALSSFCRYLVKIGGMESNPVRLVRKPKVEKRLPEYYRNEAMEKYFADTEIYASQEYLDAFIASPNAGRSRKELYEKRLARLIISMFYATGLRRSELIGLKVGSVDLERKKLKVVGKGNKMREIPLVTSLCEELLLYLKAVEALVESERSLKEPLLVTYTGRQLYPVYVDRAVKRQLGSAKEIKGRKSPHVLRHSIATELMNEGTDINSIKELLGHSSLATTQVYTHSSFARLKNIYEQAHPRAKNGGKNGD